MKPSYPPPNGGGGGERDSTVQCQKFHAFGIEKHYMKEVKKYGD